MSWFEPVTSIFKRKCDGLSFQVDVDTKRQYEVVEALARSYREKYRHCEEWKSKILVSYSLEDTSISTMFNLQSKSQDGKVQQVLSDISITDPGPKMSGTIVVLGKPVHGKTTLCNMLAYHWSSSTSSMSDFTLCISYHLKELDLEGELADLIVIFSTMMLAKWELAKEEVSKTLASISGKILLILDGYDELSNRGQKRVQDFLKNKSVFHESTVILTSRPVSDCSFIDGSDKVIHIGGFSYEYLLKVLQNTPVSEARMDCFRMYLGRDYMLDYLCEFSPFFTGCIWMAVSKGFYITPTSTSKLDVLMRHVTEILAWYFEKEQDVVNAIYLKLGELFYRALVCGKVSFCEKLLREVFNGDFDFLIDCNFFYRDREEKEVLTVSSKILMVYFATEYLRHSWKILGEKQEREEFLKNVFCLGTSTGDYIFGRGENPFLYYIGLIPEIVLNFRNQRSLQQATFEMYHDVEGTETTEAFDSVNLLLRVSDTHLGRFHFRKLAQNDPTMLQTYSSVLSALKNTSFSVFHSFYQNVFEETTFLKVSVTDFDGSEGILRAVCKSNTGLKLDRLLLDFSFSLLDEIFGMMSQLLSICLKGLRIPEGWKYYSFQEFVFSLVWSIVENKPAYSVAVTCLDDVKRDIDPYRENISFVIVKPDVDSQHQVEVSNGSVRLIKVYQGLVFWKCKKDVMADINARYGDERTQRICIDVIRV